MLNFKQLFSEFLLAGIVVSSLQACGGGSGELEAEAESGAASGAASGAESGTDVEIERLALIESTFGQTGALSSSVNNTQSPNLGAALEAADIVVKFPLNDSDLYAGRGGRFVWQVSATALAKVTYFDLSIYDAAADETVYSNNLISPKSCSDSGLCSLNIDAASIPRVGSGHVWHVATSPSDPSLNVMGRFNVVPNYESRFTDAGDVDNGLEYVDSVQPVNPEISENKLSEVPDNSGNDDIKYDRALYVTTAGNDSNSGLSIRSPLGTIQKAVDMANPGDIVYVKAGKYSNQRIVVGNSGTENAPVRIHGFQNTPGDAPEYPEFSAASVIDSAIMPLLAGQSRASGETAVHVNGSYIEIKNFQITDYAIGLYAVDTQHSWFENIVLTNLGNTAFGNGHSYDGLGIKLIGSSSSNNMLRRCIVVNSTGEGISVSGTYNILEHNAVYSDDNSTGEESATDYYFNLHNASHSIVRDNHIERIGDLDHGGHGFTAIYESQYNLFENNTAINIEGGGFVARYSQAAYNTFRGNKVVGGAGILVSSGAHDNIFEDMEVDGAFYGIWMFDSKVDPLNVGGFSSLNNIFRNIKLAGITRSVINFDEYVTSKAISSGNIFQGLMIDTAPYLFRVGHYTENNMLKDSTVRNVANYSIHNSGHAIDDFSMSMENVRSVDSGF